MVPGFTDNGSNYTFSGTPAAATTALRALMFIPTPNQLPVGLSATTTFTLVVDDSFASPVTDTSYSITALSVNDTPLLTGVSPESFQGGNRPFHRALFRADLARCGS